MKTALFSLFFYCFSAFAQSPAYRQFTINDGLPSSEVYYVILDSKGFIWFCTNAGISRFDGYSFRNFSIEDGLPDNSVFELLEDNKGRLWTRTRSGNICYIQNDSVINVKAKVEKQMNPTSFVVNNEGEIIIGLYNMDGYMAASPPYTKFNYQSTPPGFYIYEEDSSKFVYGFSNKYRSFKIDSIRIFSGLKKVSINWRVNLMSYDTYKCIKLGMNHFLISLATDLFEIENGVIINEKKLDKPIVHLSLDKNNGLWIGTKGAGAFYYKNRDPFKSKPEHFFGNDNISCVLIDKEDAIWATSTDRGVYYIHSTDINVLDAKQGLPDNDLIFLEKYNDTSMFVVVKNGLFSLVSTNGRIIKNFDLRKQGINYISQIKKITNTALMICSNRTYILQIDNMILREIKDNEKPIFNKIAIVSKGKLISAGFSRILSYDIVSKKLNNIPVDFRINSFAKGNGDTIWIACNDKLRYLIDTTIYDVDKNKSIYKDIEDISFKNGRLYLASSSKGLLIKEGGAVTQIDRSSGLKSGICKLVNADEQNVIWLVTNAGISKILSNNNEFHIENIDYLSGLPTFEIKQFLPLKGRLFAASNIGLLILEEKSSDKNNYPAPVYITQIYLNDTLISSKTHNFKCDQNYFSFDFVGLSYKKGKKQIYRYDLEGLKSGYKYTTATSVQYPALPPGNYTFAVTCVDEKNNVTGKTALYPFIINNPFWKETWFIILSTLSIVLVISIVLKQKIKQEKEKATFKTQIAETELIALRAQMNPHFIFNTINSIQNFILKNNKIQAYEYLSRFSQLIRNVLEFSKTESISLEQELSTLELYMQLEALRFDEQFDYKIEVDPSINKGSVYIPAMLIQPYIENAIWHGIMHGEKKGKIMISIHKQGKSINCIIDDNGIGRKRSSELKGVNKLKHKSLGIEVTAQRMNILGKTMGVETKVEIEDKYDDKGKAQGTKVFLSFPMLKE